MEEMGDRGERVEKVGEIELTSRAKMMVYSIPIFTSTQKRDTEIIRRAVKSSLPVLHMVRDLLQL